MKKLSLLFLLLALFSQAAFAIIPLLVAGARVASVALKTSAGQDVAIGSALGIGLIVAQINWNRVGTDGSSKTNTLYYSNTPRPPTSIETAAGFTSGSPSLTPPSTSASSFLSNASYAGGNFSGATATIAIAAAVAADNAYLLGVGSALHFTLVSCVEANANCLYHNDRDNVNITRGANVGCASGYTLSGVTCNLSNAALVNRPEDGFCPMTRSGNTYAKDASDPDCNTTMASPTFAADGSWSVTGADGRTISSALSGSGVPGERKITYTDPDTATNTTHTREIILQDGSTASDSAYIKGVIDKYTSGTGAANVPGTAIAAPVAAAGTTTVNVDLAPVVAAVNANTASREARDAGEAARTASDRAAERAIPSTGEIIPKESIPFIYTPTIFASSASCPADIPLNFMSKSYTISYIPMCNLMGIMRPLFLAFGALASIFIFVGGLKL